jgi:hypothetical protein
VKSYNCAAIYQVNEELHVCRKRRKHKGRHKAKFEITPRTDHERPLCKSRVVLRWTKWKAM